MDLACKAAAEEELTRWVRDARDFTFHLVEDLTDEQLLGKIVATVNPMIWHVGHIAWFQERWVLRHLNGRPTLRPEVDALYDSFEVAHEIRWDLAMPGRESTLAYAAEVLENVLETVRDTALGEEATYYNRLSVFHEDMHDEAMIHDRQTQRYSAPTLQARAVEPPPEAEPAGPLPGDVEVPGAQGYMLGGSQDMPYVFDNEKWAHPVDVAPFHIARAAVTNGEFAQFVEAGGYRSEQFWSIRGRLWLGNSRAKHPVYWRPGRGGGWRCRRFDRWEPIREHQPALHVNWFEAEAYCNWAGRRLPTEAEWELAAATVPAANGSLLGEKRRYPWGDAAPTPQHANLDCHSTAPADVAALPDGDSAHGCRQMLGNVWEWTADAFYPYPGFVVDPYREYSAPWFGYHKVLRGGSWATRSRMIRNTWRNFFMPDRSDVFAGFRTCSQ
ncbi:MAG: selenoneine synthase SenA [SAR324 cluster bacterium]|nr:selenoneine synthase SenA [SAR324 cluster bacterium]MCZ6730848.1 selenoneine synthase SenA [SAR324 cluster bacterium]